MDARIKSAHDNCGKGRGTDRAHFRFAPPACDALLSRQQGSRLMTTLARRPWVPEHCESYIQELAPYTASSPAHDIAHRVAALIDRNHPIPERDGFNLNHANTVLNQPPETGLAAGTAARPALR